MSIVKDLQDAVTLDTAITDLGQAKAEIARLQALVQYQKAAPVFPVVKNKTGLDHEKRRRLKNMKVFILDNTLREPSVGAMYGHTVQDKYDSMKWVKRVGMTDVIVGALGGTQQVDDQHCIEMKESGADVSHNWAFGSVAGDFSDENVPIGMQKCKEYGITNVVLEVGASDEGCFDWAGKGAAGWVELFTLHLRWCKEHLGENARVILNIWDCPTAMLKRPQRVLDIVAGLAKLPKEIRPMGFMFEEPTGEYFPGEVATWTGMFRQTMDKNGWPSTFQTNTCDAHFANGQAVNAKEESLASDGILILHVHKTWGLGDAQNLEALAAGADGMCAAVCEEGAAMGHVSTCVQLANLARLGNKYVTRRFNLKKIAEAARACTVLATGKTIHDRQVVYGPRAVEAVFGFGGIGGGVLDVDFDRDGDGDVDATDHFSLAKLLGLDEAPLRLHILSTPGQFEERMGQCFGDEEMAAAVEKENAAFAEKCKEDGSEPMTVGARLHKKVHENLNDNIEAEYTSPIGLAKLFEQVAGYRTPEMGRVIAAEAAGIEDWQKSLLAKAESSFKAHVEATGSTDGKMGFADFNREYLERVFTQHNAFPSYFEPATQQLVHNTIKEVFDTNNDGRISWTEWKTWNLWALTCYTGEVQTCDDLHNVIVRHAVMPLLCKKA
mmetsp:Transcript_51462/g.145027  ORF Transcript_51462/g.145027 Transcript_51462/m.145027 type:complete len:665 (-) Transcript_51462:100-2094(-)